MNDAEFRESIREIGPLLPVLECGGQVLDGRRRKKLCAEVGREPRILELEPTLATRALWVLHPDRALERAGKQSLDEYARAFGVRALHVAEYLNAKRVNVPIIVAEAITGTGGSGRLVQTWWPTRLHYLAGVAAKERGMNLSAFVREAVATHVSRTLTVENALELHGVSDGRAHPRKSRTIAGVEHRPGLDTPDLRGTYKRGVTRKSR